MRAFLPFTQQYQGSNSCQKMQYSVISESFFFSYLAVVVVDGSSDDKTVASSVKTETLSQLEVLYAGTTEKYCECYYLESNFRIFIYIFWLCSTEFREGDEFGSGNRTMTECSTCTSGVHTICVMKMQAVLCARVSDDDNKTSAIHLLVRNYLFDFEFWVCIIGILFPVRFLLPTGVFPILVLF